MKHRPIIYCMMAVVAIVTAILTGCTPTPENATLSNSLPPIYPYYTDITIPCNIAPLNFVVRGEVEAVEAKVNCQGEELVVNAKGDAVCFDQGTDAESHRKPSESERDGTEKRPMDHLPLL